MKLFRWNFRERGILEIYLCAKWDENLNIRGWSGFEAPFSKEEIMWWNYVRNKFSRELIWEEKLNSSELSALKEIEWIPLEFPFSFFLSSPLSFFFFWYWKLIDVEELSRKKPTSRERESQLFRTIFKINIPKILKKQRESETLSNTFNLIESQRERIEGK